MNNLSTINLRAVARRITWSAKGIITIVNSVVVVTLLCGALSVQAQQPPRQVNQASGAIRIKLTSVYVDNQEKALKFYTEVLGFVKKRDIPVGKAKWLTVVSPEDPNGTELLLEPSDNPATKAFKKAVFEQGIPFTAFAVDDLQKEFERMKKLGVAFSVEPTKAGPAKIAVFDDTCGNLIQLYQVVDK
jgi:catechol 2,3-dioxygenase-like lactoylglutathione lyase family enzyme